MAIRTPLTTMNIHHLSYHLWPIIVSRMRYEMKFHFPYSFFYPINLHSTVTSIYCTFIQCYFHICSIHAFKSWPISCSSFPSFVLQKILYLIYTYKYTLQLAKEWSESMRHFQQNCWASLNKKLEECSKFHV